MPNVSFTAPTDYAAQLEEIQRQRQLAQFMLQQGSAPIEQYSAGGMAGKTSWTQALAKALQMGMAGYKEKQAKTQQAGISKQYQQDLADVLSKSMGAMTGTPAIPDQQPTTYTGGVPGPEGTPMPTQSPMLDEQGNQMPPIPGQAAVAPNPMKAAMLMMQHPATQAMGQMELQKIISEMRRQEILKSMGIGVPGVQAGTLSAAPSSGSSQPFSSGLSVDPTAAALTLADDPLLQSLGKMQEARASKMAEPVNVRQGGAVYVPGQSKPAFMNPRLPEGMIPNYGAGSQLQGAGVIPGFGQATTDISRIPKPGSAPVQIPLSEGQNAQLSQPEYLRFQQTGELPPRYQSAPQISPRPDMQIPPGVQAQRDLAASNIGAGLTPSGTGPALPSSAVLGVPGLTQSQQSQIVQKGAASASQEAGKESMTAMYRTYEKLQDVPQQLQNIEQAKALVPQAGGFMGPGGESLLYTAKFLNDRLGMGINTEGVKGAEEMRTRIFMNVMDNLKKMDAQPSQLQQQIMMSALGSLGTDPNALPRMLDAYGQALAGKVQLHNARVINAKRAGVVFAGGDPIIDMSSLGQPQQAAPMAPAAGPAPMMGPPPGAVRRIR